MVADARRLVRAWEVCDGDTHAGDEHAWTGPEDVGLGRAWEPPVRARARAAGGEPRAATFPWPRVSGSLLCKVGGVCGCGQEGRTHSTALRFRGRKKIRCIPPPAAARRERKKHRSFLGFCPRSSGCSARRSVERVIGLYRSGSDATTHTFCVFFSLITCPASTNRCTSLFYGFVYVYLSSMLLLLQPK